MDSNMPNYLEYQKSISEELISIKDRLRYFIDDHHWPEDGRYKEIILIDILRKHLPKSVSVGTGFVVGNGRISTQIDIIIYRNDFPTMFQQSDFVILAAEAVLGVIEVKSHIANTTQLIQAINKLTAVSEILGKSTFSGIFSFDGFDGMLNRGVNAHLNSALIGSSGKVNCLCVGNDIFIKYWPPLSLSQANSAAHYSFYKIDNLSFGYFISNLVEDVYIATTGTNLPSTLLDMFYPIENTKEAHKLIDVTCGPFEN